MKRKQKKATLADAVWAALDLGDADGKPYDVTRAKKRAVDLLSGEWWEGAPRVFYSAKSIEFIFLGTVTDKRLQAAAKTTRFKVEPLGDGEGQLYCLYFVRKKSSKSESSQVLVLGLIEADQLRKHGYTVSAKLLSKDRALGWGRFEGMKERRLRRFEAMARDTRAGLRLFTFPVRCTAGPTLHCARARVTRDAVVRRCVQFVAETAYDLTLSDEAIMERWTAEALPAGDSVPSDGLHPLVLQRPDQSALLAAYFVGAATAAVSPDSEYTRARRRAEQLYVKWLIQHGGYHADEEHAIWLLERNGWQGLLTECADLDDQRVFRALHPGKPTPLFAGWLPFHMCPEEFFDYAAQGRRISRGFIRWYYADIEQVVVRVMELDHEYFQSTARVALRQDLHPLVRDIPRMMEDEMKALCARQQKSYTERTGGGGGGKSSGAQDWDLPIEELIDISPPCIRNMLAEARRNQESLKDRQRFWLVRYLKGLGYGIADYDYLAKPLWLEAAKKKGVAPTDQRYRADFDPRYGFEQDKCARAYCSGTNGIIEDTLTRGGGQSICKCPYAARLGTAEGATQACKAEWSMRNPGKVRDDKPLYYPQQHAYWNRRRAGGRRHVQIEMEEDPG